MLVSLMAGVLVASVTALDDYPPKSPAEQATICGSGKARDVVHVRVFPINIVPRIFPSPKEIMERGSSSFMVRQFWKGTMGEICDQSLPNDDTSTYEFLPRIVVFVEGEEHREPLLLEYPDWQDNPAPVRARVNGKMVTVPAAIVRRLLDYSRPG